MLEYTPEPETRPAPVYRTDPAAPTMAQPAAAPVYAWAAEPAGIDYSMQTRDRSRVLRPLAFAAAGAVAAAAGAAALVVVLSGPTPSTAVSTPNSSVAIAGNQAKTAPPPTPTVTPAPQPTIAQHPQVHRSTYKNQATSSRSTAVPTPASTPSTSVIPTTSDDTTPNHYQTQWQPWHDTTQPSWNWKFFRRHLNSWDRDDSDHDSSSSNYQSSDN